jgi:hypothetical protein
MGWLRRPVWRMGLGIGLALAGAGLMYAGGAREANETLLWAGLALFVLAMLVPLIPIKES